MRIGARYLLSCDCELPHSVLGPAPTEGENAVTPTALCEGLFIDVAKGLCNLLPYFVHGGSLVNKQLA
jgi:hypothetical protein